MPQRAPLDPDKLIASAEDLATHHEGPGRPKHTLLRRAISTAYYALYHCLCREAAEMLLPSGSDEQKLWAARAFGHREIKDCCGWIAGRQGGVRRPVRPIVDVLKQTPFLNVADVFWDLQEARHQADYDHLAVFSKAQAVAFVEDARTSIHQVRSASEDDRRAFFSLLALRAQLPK